MAVQPIARRRNAPGLSDGSVDHLRAGTNTPTATSATGTTRQTAAAGHEARTPVRSPIGSNGTSLVAGNAGRGAASRALGNGAYVPGRRAAWPWASTTHFNVPDWHSTTRMPLGS